MRKVAISACLLGEKCRYDATDNRNDTLLTLLEGVELIPFCPEDYAFGTPRATMDLVKMSKGNRAVSNVTGEDISLPVLQYAIGFFDKHHDIDLYIGKDRSPSCGVCSSKLYDENKELLSKSEAGLMTQEAQKRNILCIDAEKYRG
ncbi:MAG: hypothetical protein COA92_01015 [Sulfurovum sp.]|nr:MAG: hypothetical protein COA92_01015 [Sulfurovum sp.]